MGYEDQEKCVGPSLTNSPSVLDNMKRRKLQLEEGLKDVNDCIQALEANPEITRVLELISKTRR